MVETKNTGAPPDGRPARTEEISMFRHLLVAIDRSSSTPVTLSYVTALARQDDASVHVLHVNRYLVGGRGITELPESEATALVDDAVRLLADEGVAATGSVARSTCFNIGAVVADEALDHQSQVVVLGSRRRKRLPAIFGQGTRERITRASALPVLTAPAPMRVPSRGRGRGRTVGLARPGAPGPAAAGRLGGREA